MPEEVLELLRQWQSVTPYNQPATGSLRRPIRAPTSVLACTIVQDSHQAGGTCGWTSCHRVAQFPAHGESMGQRSGSRTRGRETLLRHEDIATTSNVYGDLGMKAKRRIQQRMVEFVRRQASEEASKHETNWRQNPPVTIQ